jgi:hypothetical protein
MNVFKRDDGLFDVEGRLIDTKPFAFARVCTPEPLPPGSPLHDLSIRLTVDAEFFVRDIEASSDSTPYPLCKEAESTLSVLVGERIASGWSAKVKSLLRGSASCTHLMEMLIPMATAALQGIIGSRREGHTIVDVSKVQVRLDSCFTYARHRSVIQQFWPQHYQNEDN